MPADDLRLTALKLQRMIRHRGPDGSGVHLAESAVPGRRHVVAHERLAINGGVGGNQPLYSHDGLASLSVNGEIYNHKQLEAQLADKRPFATGSDCEVIVHAFREYGLDVASKLDGDFAFVIVDEKTGELYAARDPMGVNSLYFGYGSDGSLWFASEMKAIVGQCERVMVFPPGHYYSSRTRQLHRYYAPKWQDVGGAVTPLDLARVRADFEAAVSKRLMAEVPFGVLLSGGLDSSIVASLVAKQFDDPKKLKTFSCARARARTAGIAPHRAPREGRGGGGHGGGGWRSPARGPRARAASGWRARRTWWRRSAWPTSSAPTTTRSPSPSRRASTPSPT